MDDSTDIKGPVTGQTTRPQQEEQEERQQEESKGPAQKMLLLSLAAFGLGA